MRRSQGSYCRECDPFVPLRPGRAVESACSGPTSHCTGATKAADCRSSCQRSDAAFRDRARDILSSGQTITAGAVHLIGLEDIRDHLGKRWETVKDRVRDYTGRLLEKILSPQDGGSGMGKPGSSSARIRRCRSIMKRCTERQLLQRSRRRHHDTPLG
ncbi:hypothetical protein GCM10022293_10230 [Azospirillum formosense]